jgi:hypothetical protein
MLIHVQRGRERAIMLMECMMYCSVLMIIIILAVTAFNRMTLQSSGLRRDAGDIERALKAGELWRKDVRAAVAPPRFETVDDAWRAFVIPHANGEVVYSTDGTNVHRRAFDNPWQITLAGVKASRMELDQRSAVAAWRWEVELAHRQKIARVRPLFTFSAVVGGGTTNAN